MTAQALSVISVALEHSQYLGSPRKNPAAPAMLTHRLRRASLLFGLCIQGVLPGEAFTFKTVTMKMKCREKSQLWEAFSSSEIIKRQIDGRAASSPMRNLLPILCFWS